jgi:YD repeat-containing protein
MKLGFRADRASDTSSICPLSYLPAREGTSLNPADAVLVVEAMATYTDPRGHDWVTRLDYGGFGLPVEQTDPLDYLTVMHRDADGLAYFLLDALDYRTRYQRDGQGNVLKQIDADDVFEEFSYNGFSQMTTFIDRGGFLWESVFDGDGNLTDFIWPDDDDVPMDEESRENNPHWVYTVDTDGNRLTETNPLEFTTTFGYDAYDRLETITYPDDDMNSMNNPTVVMT